MLIGRNRGHFFLIFLSPRAKLPTPDWSSGENTCFWLAENAISTFSWFLHFVPRQLQLLSGSLEFVCAKNTWKSSATATMEIPKGEHLFLTRNSKILFVSKAKILIGFDWLKNRNHSRPRPSSFTSLRLLPTNDNRTIITVPFWWEEGRSRSNSVEENYFATSFFGPTVCYFYRSVFVRFSSSRKLHSVGESKLLIPKIWFNCC